MTNRANISRNEFIKLAGTASLSIVGSSISEKLEALSSFNSSPLPNIVILVFDAFSALNMSLYGYPRPTTPNFERFAKRATVYHQHYSPANFTTPGTASLLTGVMPWTHRGVHLQGTTIEFYNDRNIFSLLPKDYYRFAYTHNTLVQIQLDQFRKNINELLKVSDLSLYSNILVDKVPLNEFHIPLEAELISLKESYRGSLFLSILDKKFEEANINRLNQLYKDEFPRGLPGARAGKPTSYAFTIETARKWLTTKIQNNSQPFFGYVHLFPPHSPYNPNKNNINIFKDKIEFPNKPQHHFTMNESKTALVRLRRHYDENIAYVDEEFGKLLDALEQANAMDNLCLVVTSDHGEINERGISYHNTPVLYEPLIRIPLIISYPGQKDRQDIFEKTQSIDVLPAVLKLSGIEPPDWIEGFPLPKHKQDKIGQRDIYAVEAKSCAKNGQLTPATFSLVHEDHKLIYYRGYSGFDEVYELYNLQEDREELQNLVVTQPKRLKETKEILFEKISRYI